MSRCQCGKPKYYDAPLCEACWKAEEAWSDAAPGNSSPLPDNSKCQCGKSKYADASSCDECYEKAQPYFDSRDG